METAPASQRPTAGERASSSTTETPASPRPLPTERSARILQRPGVGFVSPDVVTGSSLQTGFWQADGLGSTQSVLDNQAKVQSGYLYDAFGATSVLFQSSLWFTPYQYVGGEGYYTDGDDGMQLLGARYYLPALGRFLTQDPLGQGAGLNLYAYCDDNPIAYSDPEGLTLTGILDAGFVLADAYFVVKDFVEDAPGWQKSLDSTALG